MTIEAAMNGWKKSKPHNDVILNKDIWRDTEWTKIGAAVYGPYANAWFSDGNGVSKRFRLTKE